MRRKAFDELLEAFCVQLEIAAESLGKIGKGNQKAINNLLHLLRSNSGEFTRRRVVQTLRKIEPGNQKTINSLVHLLGSASDYKTHLIAAEILGKIDPGNRRKY